GLFRSIMRLVGGLLRSLMLYSIASKVRKSEIYTVPQLMEKRFGKITRFIASIIILFAFIGITAYQFTGGAYVLQLTTGMSLEWGAIIICILVIFLTVSGGSLLSRLFRCLECGINCTRLYYRGAFCFKCCWRF